MYLALKRNWEIMWFLLWPLPIVEDEGLVEATPLVVLDKRVMKHGSALVPEVLVQWKHSVANAPWEKYSRFHCSISSFYSLRTRLISKEGVIVRKPDGIPLLVCQY